MNKNIEQSGLSPEHGQIEDQERTQGQWKKRTGNLAKIGLALSVAFGVGSMEQKKPDSLPQADEVGISFDSEQKDQIETKNMPKVEHYEIVPAGDNEQMFTAQVSINSKEYEVKLILPEVGKGEQVEFLNEYLSENKQTDDFSLSNSRVLNFLTSKNYTISIGFTYTTEGLLVDYSLFDETDGFKSSGVLYVQPNEDHELAPPGEADEPGTEVPA